MQNNNLNNLNNFNSFNTLNNLNNNFNNNNNTNNYNNYNYNDNSNSNIFFYVPYKSSKDNSKKPKRFINNSEEQTEIRSKIYPIKRPMRVNNTPSVTVQRSRYFPRVSNEKSKKQMVLSKYTNREKISEGSFWNVYKVTDENNRTVVLKESARYLMHDNYKREFTFNALIKDETFLVKMETVLEDKEMKAYYAIMPLYCCTIEDVIAKRRMKDEEIIYVVRCILQALQQMNKIGYVHLDVKPSNMFVDFNGQIKLGDFGTTRQIGSGVDIDEIGDGRYMAPEALHRIVTPENDIFSLGISFYEMVSGNRFPGYDQTFDIHDDSILEDLRYDEFRNLFKMMTKIQCEKRYTVDTLLNFSIFWSIGKCCIDLDEMEVVNQF